MGDESKWKKRLLWISLTLIVVFVVLPLGLLATGYIYQTIASKSDWERYPPPGELIDIGGYRLHLNCTGDFMQMTLKVDGIY